MRAISLLSALIPVLAGASRCAASGEQSASPGAPTLAFVDAGLAQPVDAASPRAAAAESARRDSASCHDVPSDTASVSCDGESILLPSGLALGDPLPAGTQRILSSVAQLITRHQELLLVRIEVQATRPPPSQVAARARQLQRAQDLANAVFRFLYRRRGVSAERLEPVGVVRPTRAAAPAYVLVLSIRQRAR
jgi:hypothetical protein